MVVGMRNAPGVVVVETETVSRCRDDIIDRGLLGLRFVQITRVTQQMQTQIFSSAWLLTGGGLCRCVLFYANAMFMSANTQL